MLFVARPPIIEIVKSFFPIICYRYWFMTTYFVLILLVPIINRAFDSISKESYKKIIAVLIICFCVWQTVLPFVTTVDDMQGYSIIWFVTVYIVGGYIRKYGISIVSNKWRIPIALLAATAYLLYSLVVQVISEKTNITTHIPYYNSIFALIASVALFNFFYSVNIKGRVGQIIICVSKSVFAIYLISDNPLVRGILYSKVLKIDNHINNGIKSVSFVLISSIMLFIICLGIDVIRRGVISILKRK